MKKLIQAAVAFVALTLWAPSAKALIPGVYDGDLDIVAAFFGFKSGHELAQAVGLVTAAPDGNSGTIAIDAKGSDGQFSIDIAFNSDGTGSVKVNGKVVAGPPVKKVQVPRARSARKKTVKVVGNLKGTWGFTAPYKGAFKMTGKAGRGKISLNGTFDFKNGTGLGVNVIIAGKPAKGAVIKRMKLQLNSALSH